MSGNLDLNGNELILDEDGDTSITSDTDDIIHVKIAGQDELHINTNFFRPAVNNAEQLG